VRRSAVRFATLKRRFRFNAYFSLCSFCLLWDIFVYLQQQQQHTLVSPKCLRNFFFVNSCLFFLFPSVCFLPLLSHYFWPIFCFFRLIFLRFLKCVLHFEVRRKINKSNVTLSFIHARTRAFIWTRSRTDRALESNELNGRNISSWIKAKYDRERASREITRLDVVTRAKEKKITVCLLPHEIGKKNQVI